MVTIYPIAPTPLRHVHTGDLVRIAELGLEYTGCCGHVTRIDEGFIWVRTDLRFGLDYYPIVPVQHDVGVKVL
jgi:hypothetical protein